ncbi:hypothetical protein F383_14451 [Gossypium arboreum]|uniref:Uncharacterized protein n=1 Tax=Gossypium arboreum TaxID=29729 RepID=A0A0B0NDB6_GOSAR|nr:hypothetical protein F383_14451 [Gossypium arboreum]
MFTAATQT